MGMGFRALSMTQRRRGYGQKSLSPERRRRRPRLHVDAEKAGALDGEAPRLDGVRRLRELGERRRGGGGAAEPDAPAVAAEPAEDLLRLRRIDAPGEQPAVVEAGAERHAVRVAAGQLAAQRVGHVDEALARREVGHHLVRPQQSDGAVADLEVRAGKRREDTRGGLEDLADPLRTRADVELVDPAAAESPRPGLRVPAQPPLPALRRGPMALEERPQRAAVGADVRKHRLGRREARSPERRERDAVVVVQRGRQPLRLVRLQVLCVQQGPARQERGGGAWGAWWVVTGRARPTAAAARSSAGPLRTARPGETGARGGRAAPAQRREERGAGARRRRRRNRRGLPLRGSRRGRDRRRRRPRARSAATALPACGTAWPSAATPTSGSSAAAAWG